MKRAISTICGSATCLIIFNSPLGRAEDAAFKATVVRTNPWVISESKHDTTEAFVREMSHEVSPVNHSSPRHHFTKTDPVAVNYKRDLAVQTAAGPTVAATIGLNFEGLGSGLPIASVSSPPDTNLSVGVSQVVEIINFEFAVFDKATGHLTYGPADITAIWSGFGGSCENLGRGDPIVLFDKAAQRWVIAELAGPGPETECVAISQTADATGGYYRYSFNLGNVDYVKLGVWPDAYYLSNNVSNGSGFPEACALDRSRMLIGASATAQCFFPVGLGGFFLPSDLDGSFPPPAGSPNVFVGLDAQASMLALHKFHVDFSTPSNSTFTGPITLSVESFQIYNIGVGIPQPGVSEKLESGGTRVMYRLAYRNFGDHESLVVNHTVDAGGGVAGIRWYEIRGPGSASPTVYQQGTFSPDSTHRWMGSIAMDNAGDIALGYSVSSSSIYPSIRYTGRLSFDPLGTLETEATLINGSGSMSIPGATLFRWGDYTSMSIDPVDDCTFWYANEYLTETGLSIRTWVASFKFPTCGIPTATTVGIAVKPGEDPPRINPRNHGTTPVAILSSSTFNAPAQVDKTSLTFGHTGDEKSLAFCSGAEDVNRDGLPDLVCHFTTALTGFRPGDTVATLKGKTVTGLLLKGMDTIVILPR